MSVTQSEAPSQRSTFDDPVLPTVLVWNPRVHRPGNQRGALVGTLLGVPVTGMDTGRGVAYQFGTIRGEVRTVWWGGYLEDGAPVFFDVDTQERVARNPIAVAWFTRLDKMEEK